MKLWELGPCDDLPEGLDHPWYAPYDMVLSFVICAETEIDARVLASQNAGDEGEDVWLSSYTSYCQEYQPPEITSEPRVIMRDFNPG